MTTTTAPAEGREQTRARVAVHRVVGSRWGRAAVLAVLLIVLEWIVFRGYWSGAFIPPWDFIGSYTTDAFAWWTNGSFFAPPEWIPNAWAGYPSAVMLQNSAWYIPTGIISLFGPFTLHSAAILGALHVAFGSVGAYLLARSLRASFPVALFVATASFFGVGYFTNAEHVDIARGYAWVPWVLLVLSTAWPWRKWWSIPVASLLLWQAATGIYPGMVVTAVYAGVVWIVVGQIIARPRFRAFILPALISLLVAGLLSAPRLLPYLLLQAGTTARLPETSQFGIWNVGTLLFGYGNDAIAGDISMRAFFIPAGVLVLLFFARWRDLLNRMGLALVIPSFLLGMPFLPWFGAVQALPGLSLSRITMSDFKVFLVLGLLLIAASGLRSVLELAGSRPRFDRPLVIRVAAALLFLAVMAVIGIGGPFRREDWFPPLLIAALLLAVIVGSWFVRSVVTRASLAALLVIGTAVSGIVWAYTTDEPWRAERVPSEIVNYGATIQQLLSERTALPTDQRPARIPPDRHYDERDLFKLKWNASYYTGRDAVGGYINLKGSTTEEALDAALTSTSRGTQFASFLAAPGTLLSAESVSRVGAAALQACGTQGRCGPADVTPERYSPGNLTYRVSTDSRVQALANEAYFKGWSATACTTSSSCVDVPVSANRLGVIQLTLPAGDYDLNLVYKAPGRVAGWVAFGAGVLLAAAAALVLAVPRRRRRGTPHE